MLGDCSSQHRPKGIGSAIEKVVNRTKRDLLSHRVVFADRINEVQNNSESVERRTGTPSKEVNVVVACNFAAPLSSEPALGKGDRLFRFPEGLDVGIALLVLAILTSRPRRAGVMRQVSLMVRIIAG